jgi:hypothetical protein
VYVALATLFRQRLVVVPEIIPGVTGVDDKAKVLEVLAPHELLATTLKVPETKLLEIFNVIEVVP